MMFFLMQLFKHYAAQWVGVAAADLPYQTAVYPSFLKKTLWAPFVCMYCVVHCSDCYTELVFLKV